MSGSRRKRARVHGEGVVKTSRMPGLFSTMVISGAIVVVAKSARKYQCRRPAAGQGTNG